MSDALKDHNKLTYIYKLRLETLQSLLKLWRSGDLTLLLNNLLSIKDSNLFFDALNCTFASHIPTTISLDQSCQLLDKLIDLMDTDKYENHLKIGLKVVRELLKCMNERLCSTIR